MAKEKFAVAKESKAGKNVDRLPEETGEKAVGVSEADQELAEINEAIAFGKQTESFLKKHPGVLAKAGGMAEKVFPTNQVRKYWDKFPKEAQTALLYADLGTNANVITSPVAVPLRFLRKIGIIDYKGDGEESDIDQKTSIQKGIEWLAKHYPETAEMAGPLIDLKDGFSELGKDVRRGVKEERRKEREKRVGEARAADKTKVIEIKDRIQKF
jgi:hypothetical protein